MWRIHLRSSVDGKPHQLASAPIIEATDDRFVLDPWPWNRHFCVKQYMSEIALLSYKAGDTICSAVWVWNWKTGSLLYVSLLQRTFCCDKDTDINESMQMVTRTTETMFTVLPSWTSGVF